MNLSKRLEVSGMFLFFKNGKVSFVKGGQM